MLDPRILGHAAASMTMDLYGHLIDQNLWDAARKLAGHTGGLSGASNGTPAEMTNPRARKVASDLRVWGLGAGQSLPQRGDALRGTERHRRPTLEVADA